MKVTSAYNQETTTCMYCKCQIRAFDGYILENEVARVIRHLICSYRVKELLSPEQEAEQEETVEETTTDDLTDATVQTLRVIVLPLLDNNGQDLVSEIDEVKEEIVWCVGGYSECQVSGVWIDQDTGRKYRDVSVKLEVILDREQDEHIQTCLSRWAALLRQKCILTYSSLVNAQFVAPTSNATVPLAA